MTWDTTKSANDLIASAEWNNMVSDQKSRPSISSGSGAPSSTPSKVGDIYIDTTSDFAYIAVGVASSDDWEKSATSPAGSNTYIQFNDDGSFGASSRFTYSTQTTTITDDTSTVDLSLADGSSCHLNVSPTWSLLGAEHISGTDNSSVYVYANAATINSGIEMFGTNWGASKGAALDFTEAKLELSTYGNVPLRLMSNNSNAYISLESYSDILLATASGKYINFNISGGGDVFRANATQIDSYKELDMNTNSIINVVDPTNAQDAATKNYVNTTAMGTVVHGATAGTARPSGYTVITWIGSVEPTNAVNDDIWVDTT